MLDRNGRENNTREKNRDPDTNGPNTTQDISNLTTTKSTRTQISKGEEKTVKVTIRNLQAYFQEENK